MVMLKTYERHDLRINGNIHKNYKLSGKEFQDLSGGVLYSSVVNLVLDSCSDCCCKSYLIDLTSNK